MARTQSDPNERLFRLLADTQRRLRALETKPPSKIVFPEWDTYTPALTASTSNPVLGTGGQSDGNFIDLDFLDLVIATVEIVFGSSGTDAGSGVYAVSLPVTAELPSVGNRAIGSGNVTEAGVDNDIVNPFIQTDGDVCLLIVEGANVVADSIPFA